MSWSSCMEDKIVGKYGQQAATCADGITHGNLSEVAQCIADIVGDSDPATVLAELAYWAVDCAF